MLAIDHVGMDTIAAHAHLLDLSEKEGVQAPTSWVHDLVEGSLTYRFGTSPNTFTWQAPAIASIVSGLDGAPSTGRARELLDRWDAISNVLDRSGRSEPNRLLVDHEADEMTVVWEAPDAVAVFGP